MLKRAERRESILKIRDRVDVEAEQSLELDTDLQNLSVGPGPSSNITLGSPDSPTNIYRLLQDLVIPKDFPQPDKLALFQNLQKLLSILEPELKAGTKGPPADVQQLRVVQNKLARIRYVSMEDNTDKSDLIRVTQDWRSSGRRYDFVLINLDHHTLSCAQVHLLLTIDTPSGKKQLALIRTLKGLARNAATGFIHASDSSDYRFVVAQCFVRSIFVHPPTLPSYKRYVLNDLIDADMYLRLQKDFVLR